MLIFSKFEVLYKWLNESFFYATVNKLKNGGFVYIFYF